MTACFAGAMMDGVSDQSALDEETLISLELFNQHLKVTAQETKAAKAIAKAERSKKDAAAAVAKINSDSGASPEDKAAAETAYRDAVATLAAVKADPLTKPPKPEPSADADTEADPGTDSPADPVAAAADDSAEDRAEDEAESGTPAQDEQE